MRERRMATCEGRFSGTDDSGLVHLKDILRAYKYKKSKPSPTPCFPFIMLMTHRPDQTGYNSVQTIAGGIPCARSHDTVLLNPSPHHSPPLAPAPCLPRPRPAIETAFSREDSASAMRSWPHRAETLPVSSCSGLVAVTRRPVWSAGGRGRTLWPGVSFVARARVV